MSAITAKARRKMKKYAVLTREPRCFLGSFDFSWEQRKLGEVVERITRKNENLESTLPLTISAQYGLIDQNEFFDKRIASKDVSGYFLVRNGEFAYNKSTSSDAPWGAIKRLDRYESGVLSTLYIVFKILDERKTSSDYIVTYYNTDLWHKGIQAIAAEGARNHGLLNVAPADFFETNLTMPKDYAEQQQIGSFFQMLDHLITLHQRKCALLFSSFQALISMPTQSPMLIAKAAFALFEKRYDWRNPIRSVTIQAINLVPQDTPRQVDLFMNIEKIEKAERLDQCIETIRQRFGKNSIRNGILFQNLRMPSEKPEITMPTGVLC